MARIELNIVALGDFAAVNAQVKALQVQVESLNKGLLGVGVGPQLSKELAAAQDAFKATMLSTGQFTAQTVRMSSETQKFGTALTAGKLKLSEYFQIITGKAGQATASLAALTEEQVKLQNSVVMTDPTKKGMLSVFTPTTINAAADATKLATMRQNLYNMSLDGASKSLINWGKNTQWAGRQLTVGLTMPMVMFGSAAVKSFKDTNLELTKLQRLYGEGLKPPSAAEITKISNQVLSLGKTIAVTMGISQTETVKAAASFAAMGREGQNLIDTTAQTMRLSKLGAVSTADATNTVVSLQNVYKVSTNELANAVNFLSDIQKQTTMTLGDMTQAIPRVGPIMQELGGTYKDTAVMLVAMRESGIPAAQAANAVKSAVASMIAPTSAATKEFAKFGINLDSVKKAGSPVQMIEALQAGLSKLSPLVKEQLIEKLFGKFQFARVSALLDNFGKAGSQTVNALKIAGATNQELATLANQEMKQATESVTAKWQRAIEGFKATLYPVGQKFVEIGTLILGIANKIGKAFSSLPSPIKAVLGIFAGGAAIAGPIIMLTGLVGNFAGYLLKTILNIKQLASGGKTFKEILTPEIIASQNAAQLFAAEIAGDVKAVDLLEEAIKRLTVSLEGMAGAMSTGTADVALSNAASIAQQNANNRISQQELASLPMLRPTTMAYNKSQSVVRPATFQKSHVSEAQNISYEEAQLLALDENLTASSKNIINAAIRDIRLGITKVEDFALMRLSNFVADFTSAANQGLKVENGGYTKSKIIGEELNASVYGTNFAQLEKRGVTVNSEAAAKLTAVLNQTVKDVLIFDEEFKNMDVLTDVELAKAFKKSFTLLNKNVELLDAESQKLLQGFNELNAENNILYGRIGSSAKKGFEPYTHEGVNYPGGPATGTYAPRKNMYPGSKNYLAVPAKEARAITQEIEKIWQKAGIDVPRIYMIALEEGFVAEASIATTSGEDIGRAVELGIQKGLKEQGATTEKIAAMDLTALGESLIPIAERQGMNSGKAYTIAMERAMSAEIPAVESKVSGLFANISNKISKNKGTLASGGIGMAAMMGSSYVSSIGGGNNTLANTAGTAMNAAGTVSMLGMFSEGVRKVVPELAIAATAFSLVSSATKYYEEQMRIASNTLIGSYTASTQAISAFGLTVKPFATYDFASATSKLSDHIKSVQGNKIAIDDLTQAYMNATDQFTKDYLKGVKKADPAGLLELMQVKYSTDITAGASAQKAKQDVAAVMSAAAIDPTLISIILAKLSNNTDVRKAFNDIIKSTLSDATHGPLQTATDPTTTLQRKAIEDQISATKDIISRLKQDIANPNTMKKVVEDDKKQLIKQQANLAYNQNLLNPTSTSNVLADPTITSLTTALKNLASGPIDSVVQGLSGLNSQSAQLINNSSIYSKLATDFGSMWGPGFTDASNALLKAKGTTVDLTKAITLLQDKVNEKDVFKAMSKGSYALDQLFAQNIVSIRKLQNAANSPTPTPTPTPAGNKPGDGVTYSKAQALAKKELDGALSAQNKYLKIVKDRLAQEQKITAEIKRQNDFQTSKLDLQNQIRLATASGDYLKSALLGQQVNSLQYDYNATTKQNQLQSQIDMMQSNADDINQALADLAIKVANKATDVPAAIQKLIDSLSVIGVNGGKMTVDKSGNVVEKPTTTPTPTPTPTTTTPPPPSKLSAASLSVYNAIVNGTYATYTGAAPASSSTMMNPLGGPKDLSNYIIPKFHNGGVVQGFAGQEVLALLKAGETVVPTSNSDKIDNILNSDKSMKSGDTYQITVNAGSNANADDIAKTVLSAIQRKTDMVSSNRRVVTSQ